MRAVIRRLRSDLTLDNGGVVYPRFGIGNPATGFGVFMPLGGPGTPTFAASFLPFIVYNDPTYNPATYDIDRDLRTVVDVMEAKRAFSSLIDPGARRGCSTSTSPHVARRPWHTISAPSASV